jgi:hypothetical protein
MTGARILIYTHCLVAGFCVGSFFLTAFGWRLDSLPINPAFEAAIDRYARFIGRLCLGSGFLFPACLAVVTRGQLSGWRRCVVIVEDVLLSLVQLVSLLVPIRLY